MIPIGSFRKRWGVTLSLPSVVGRDGVIEALDVEITAAESNALEMCAAALQQALREIADKS